ncbi:transaldolase family protein [Microbacterium sp. NPDC089190]|uniref:transaldolase family protein n=1 Tax=Microbacterium sp. NPDC089190 TaxID=3155063 RepID=UPI00344EC6B9
MPTTDEAPAPFMQMTRRYPTALWNDSADPEELRESIRLGAVGATCNPVIAYAAIKRNPAQWEPWLRALAASQPTWSESELGWAAVRELSVQASQQLLMKFHESGGRNGRLSIQTDPRLHRDAAALVRQAVEFSELAPNIIVKIPATAVGIQAMEEAAYRGVSINATLSFTVAQAVAVGEALERAMDRRAAQGLPDQEFGHVVTIMGGRLDDWLKLWASENRILVEPGALEWAGVAALKRAYEIFRERGFRSRILSAAFRNHLHWSELIGGDLVVSPPFDWQARINENGFVVRERISEPVPAGVLSELLSLSEFVRAYEPDGLKAEDFGYFGAARNTLRQFLEASAELDALVRDVIVPPARG